MIWNSGLLFWTTLYFCINFCNSKETAARPLKTTNKQCCKRQRKNMHA